MDQNQDQSPEAEEEETGLAGLAVPAPADEGLEGQKLTQDRPYVAVDPLAADRAARVAAIRAEAATREEAAAKAGKPIVERPEPSAALLAAAEEHAAAEARAASPFKVSSNANEVLPTREEIIARKLAYEGKAQNAQPAAAGRPVDVMTDPQYAGKTWEEVVAMRQEAARQRRYQKELAEKESNQIAKEQFKERVLAARRPETTIHRPQPIAPAISAQTLAEMEAGRKRSEEFKRSAHVTIMPRAQ